MRQLNNSTIEKPERPVRILQFGEGNFLRAFFDPMIDEANRQGLIDASAVIVSPRFKDNTTIRNLRLQDGLYHVLLEGIDNGEARQSLSLVRSVADAFSPISDPSLYKRYITSPELRFVVSNTTEAGIVYEKENGSDLMAKSFPAKVAALLYHRFRHFNGDKSKGLIFLCCELIEDNGQKLSEYVLRHAEDAGLGGEFEEWVRESCIFCDTLVDRIVSGFPNDDIEKINRSTGFEDSLVVKGELYHLWVIGGKKATTVREELPLDKAGMNVHFLPDVRAFRDKKVRVLNGSHTGMVPIALQLGCETVKDAFGNADVNAFINRMVEHEVLPMIDGNREELKQFADGILERFYNPYIRHMLQSISLNSLSKWETRNFPTALDIWRTQKRLADYELFTFAALLTLYAPDSGFSPEDDEDHLRYIRDSWSPEDIPGSVARIVGGTVFVHDFESLIPGFTAKVADYVACIRSMGMASALKSFLTDN